jgi:uncharacterized protein YhfF
MTNPELPVAASIDGLPLAEFAFPGPLRNELVAAILSGRKTSTTGLWQEYELEGLALPEPGDRSVVIDSQGRPVAIIEVTSARRIRLSEVDLAHAVDEGEGDDSVASWRAGHERFWHSAEVREELGQPDFTVDDDTAVVVQRFRLVRRLTAADPR